MLSLGRISYTNHLGDRFDFGESTGAYIDETDLFDYRRCRYCRLIDLYEQVRNFFRYQFFRHLYVEVQILDRWFCRSFRFRFCCYHRLCRYYRLFNGFLNHRCRRNFRFCNGFRLGRSFDFCHLACRLK